MPTMRRSYATEIAPPAYQIATAADAGHVPFAININSLGAFWIDRSPDHEGGPQPNKVQLAVNAAPVGPLLNLGSGQSLLATIDPGIAVPKVTEANIDGASRLALSIAARDRDNHLFVSIGYDPADSADAGKEIHSIGYWNLADEGCVGKFAAITPFFGDPGFWNTNFGHYAFDTRSFQFATQFEDNDDGRIPGDVKAVAVVPWCEACVWDDFLLVCHAAPTATFRFILRVNRQDTIVLECTSGSQRVWTPTGATNIVIKAGDQVCWKCDAAAGTPGNGLAAELLWSSRLGDEPPEGTWAPGEGDVW